MQRYWRGGFVRKQYWDALEEQAAELEAELEKDVHRQEHDEPVLRQEPEPEPEPVPRAAVPTLGGGCDAMTPAEMQADEKAEEEVTRKMLIAAAQREREAAESGSWKCQMCLQPNTGARCGTCQTPRPVVDDRGQVWHPREANAAVGEGKPVVRPKLRPELEPAVPEVSAAPRVVARTELVLAQRTYVQVAGRAGIDGDGVPSSKRDVYRALHAVYHLPGSPHDLIPAPAPAASSALAAVARSDSEPEADASSDVFIGMRYSISFLQEVCAAAAADPRSASAEKMAGIVEALLQAAPAQRSRGGRGKGRGRARGKRGGDNQKRGGKGKGKKNKKKGSDSAEATAAAAQDTGAGAETVASDSVRQLADDGEDEEDTSGGPVAGGLLLGAMDVAAWLGPHAGLSSSGNTGQYWDSVMGGTDIAKPTLRISPAVIDRVVGCSKSLDLQPRAGFIAACWAHGRRRSSDGTVQELSAVYELRTVSRDTRLGPDPVALMKGGDGGGDADTTVTGLILVSAGAGVLPPTAAVLSLIVAGLGGLTKTDELGLGVPIVVLVVDLLHTLAASIDGDGADCEAYDVVLEGTTASFEGAANFSISLADTDRSVDDLLLEKEEHERA